jgi:NTP pyrophosphatase (non-canonical NTP hydrolase)
MVIKIDPDHMAVCPDWAPADPRSTFLCLAIAGEGGELGNIAKKEWRDDITLLDKKLQEAADTMAYLLMLGEHHGVDMVWLGVKALEDFEKRPGYSELVAKARARSKAG